MSTCKRFEQEGLATTQNGEVLDSHYAECTDCRAEQKRYQVILEALRETSETGDLPNNWQEQVWNRISEESLHNVAAHSPVQQAQINQPARRSRWTMALGGLAAAVLACAILLPQMKVPLELASEVVSNPEMSERAIGAQQGDTWQLSGTVGRSKHVSLRLYLNDQLLAECGQDLECNREGGHLQASYVVERLGLYEAIVVRSEEPLPSLQGDRPSDIAQIEASNAEWARSQAIELR